MRKLTHIFRYFPIVLLVMVVSCKTPKQTESSTKIEKTEHRANDINEQSSISKQDESSKDTNTQTDEEEITEVNTTTYDTNKPVDPSTGKPPVASETNTKTTKRKGEQKNEKEQAKSVENSTYNKEDKSKININDNQENKTKETPKDPKKWRYIFIGLGSILILGMFAIARKRLLKIL